MGKMIFGGRVTKISIKKIKGKKPKLNLRKLLQHPVVVAQHRAALAGTGFEDCAPCPGCSGKTHEGKMRCSRSGPTGAFVTSVQAQRCDGSKPLHRVANEERRFLLVKEAAAT